MPAVREWSVVILVGLIAFGASGVANAQIISATPQALNFVYQIGGPNPAAQSIRLSSSTPTQFAVTISGASWLSVTPASGVTDASLTAIVTAPADAKPGTYSGSILIGPPASTDSLKTVIAVTLQVLGAPQGTLSVYPDTLSFDYVLGAPAPTPVPVTITSTGSQASFTLTTSERWLVTSALSYLTPATVFVSILPTPELRPGVYTGIVFVTPNYAGGAQKQIVVSLRVTTSGNLTASPNFLSFSYQSGGIAPPAQTLSVVSSTGGAVQFSVSATGGSPWLVYPQNVFATPVGIVISTNPSGMAPGTYYATLNLTPTGVGYSATQVQVSLTVSNSNQLLVSPTSLLFNYQQGGAVPASQYLSVKTTGPSIPFNVAVQGVSWVTTSIASGVAPTGFSVSAFPPAGTVPGNYLASIILSPSTGNPVTVSVSVQVTTPNYLTLGRTSVSFDYSVGGTNPPPAIVPVTSSSGSVQFEAVAATSGSVPWLNVSQSSQYTPANISISVAPQNLAAGTYSGTVVVNSEGASNGQQSIAVTLVVTKSVSMVATPFGLIFSYQMNLNSPSPQMFTVKSDGGSADFTVSTTTTSGGNWLLTAGGGVTPATVVAAVNADSLGPGTYTGHIVIKAKDDAVPVLNMPVVLNVSPAPVYLPAANHVAFQYLINGPAPATQQVKIDASAGAYLVFYPTILTADGGTWLTATPDVGVTPTNLTLTVDPKDLKPGLYYGLVALNDPADESPISFIPVSLQTSDTQILSIPAQQLVFSTNYGLGSIAPQVIQVKGTGRSSQYHITTSAKWLTADPADGYTDATVNVRANATGLASGYYLGVVTIEIPGIANSQQLVPVALVVAPLVAEPKM